MGPWLILATNRSKLDMSEAALPPVCCSLPFAKPAVAAAGVQGMLSSSNGSTARGGAATRSAGLLGPRGSVTGMPTGASARAKQAEESSESTTLAMTAARESKSCTASEKATCTGL